MKREQFLQMLREDCDRAGRAFIVQKSEGKGRHYRVYAGDRNTIVKSGELSPLYMKVVRKQLDLR